MALYYEDCPHCGFWDLAPRKILVGKPDRVSASVSHYCEIFTLKCQNCGWLGEQAGQGGCAV